MIQPIDTPYRGYLFRSRLEARWAVFFDALGITWGYEVEGYQLEDGTRYLPDFWLPQVKMWAEVKAAQMTSDELHKCASLAVGTGYPCLLLEGGPDNRAYTLLECGGESTYRADCCLTAADGYPYSENRFFACPGCDCADARNAGGCWCCRRDDTARAVGEALSARFEHGEGDESPAVPVGPPPVPRPACHESMAF